MSLLKGPTKESIIKDYPWVEKVFKMKETLERKGYEIHLDTIIRRGNIINLKIKGHSHISAEYLAEGPDVFLDKGWNIFHHAHGNLVRGATFNEARDILIKLLYDDAR